MFGRSKMTAFCISFDFSAAPFSHIDTKPLHGVDMSHTLVTQTVWYNMVCVIHTHE